MELFKTPTQLPFLHYTFKETEGTGFAAGEKYKSLSLDLGPMPLMEQPSIDELWTIEDNSNIQKSQTDNGKFSAAIILCSAVAFRSRRASANILIVQNEEMQNFYTTKWIEHNLAPKLTVLVDPTLEPNELRATYWRVIYKKERVGDDVVTFSEVPIAIDGGVQISPEGFSAIQKGPNVDMDYHGYFRRGFL